MESRKKNVVRNTYVAFLKFIIQYVLQFILRTVVIYKFGKEYLGLSGLFTNILGCLNLAELGIGGAIAFSMYKPVAENDIDKINSLVHLYKKIYRIIACVVLLMGLLLMPFLETLIKNKPNIFINFYIIYLIYLINAVLTYVSAYRRSLLFAYQRNDVENLVKTISLMLTSISQIIIILVLKNYYLYILCLPIFTVVDIILLYFKSKKILPEFSKDIKPLDSATKKEIKKNIFALSAHQLGGVLVLSTDNIIISASSNLGIGILGVYSNYATIITMITGLISLVATALQGSVGNYIASESSNNVRKKFEYLQFLFVWMVGFCSIALLCLFQPFILLWTRSSSWVLDFKIVLLLVVSFYLSNSITMPYIFKITSGQMVHDVWKPLVQGFVNLVASLVLVKFIGLSGIILGTILSTLSAPFWSEPFVVYKYYFKTSVIEYWKKFFVYMIVTILAGAITFFICSLLPSFGFGIFVLKTFICLVVPNIIFILTFIRTEELKYYFNLAKNYLIRFKHKREQKQVVENSETE